MAQVVSGVASDVEQLTERVHNLEKRVAALETHAATTPFPQSREPSKLEDFPKVGIPAGAVPVVGKAVLGIAGAYLLRAIAESGNVPKLPVLVAAMVYAGAWLAWAVRKHDADRFASTTYAITSAMILSPLLWEATVRFHALSSTFAALALTAFASLSLALSWRHNLQAIPWVATLAAVVTALALIIATHDLVPFTAALLVLSLATELVTHEGHRLTLRAIPALAADFAIWLLVYVMTAPEGVPPGYVALGPATIAGMCLALLAIYGGSIGLRNLAFLQRITILEIGQGIVTFLILAFAVVRLGESVWNPGAFCFLIAALCYWGTLGRFREKAQSRNRQVYGVYAAAMLLAGTFLLVPENLQAPFLSAAALAATVVYAGRRGTTSLGLHASVYLVGAVLVAGLLNYSATALAGAIPSAPRWQLWAVVAAAALSYGIGSHTPLVGWKRLLWVIPLGLTGMALAAVAVVAVVSVASSRIAFTPSSIAMTRTLVLCALGLFFAFAATRFRRPELGWLAYATIACGTAKLLFEDLRLGNAAFLVVSLLFYGLVLILMPRILARNS